MHRFNILPKYVYILRYYKLFAFIPCHVPDSTKLVFLQHPSWLLICLKKKKKIFYILVFTQVAVVTQKRNIASGWRKAVKVMPPSEKGCMSRLPWGRKDRNTSRETEVMQATSLGMIHYSGSLHCRNWLCIKMLDDNFC